MRLVLLLVSVSVVACVAPAVEPDPTPSAVVVAQQAIWGEVPRQCT
jgi:hypothetical protein